MLKLVTKKDEDLVRTAVFVSALSAKGKDLQAVLEQKCAENMNNLDDAFLLGLFYQFSQKDDQVFNHRQVKRMFEIYHQILEQDPERWLVRIFYTREMLRWLGVLSEAKEIEENLMFLLERQRQMDPQTYFIVLYILLADFYFATGQKDAAFRNLEEGIRIVPKKPIIVLPDFFSLLLLGLLSRLKDSKELDLVNHLIELGQIYFPADKRIAQLRAFVQ